MTARRAIAIVGLGGRFPGASSADGLWEVVAAGRSMAREVPRERWPVPPASVLDTAGAVDRARSLKACLLEPFDFDAAGLDVPLTPLARLAIDVARQTFSSAGTAKIDRSRTAAIIANIALPTDGASAFAEQVVLGAIDRRLADVEADPHEAFPSAWPIGVMARALGLGKGSYTLDAACASSLYALHLGCLELEAGRLDAVLAGGISLAQSLYTQVGFTQLQALSPSGVCAPFTSRADGLVVGEGAGMVLLKRLEDAERDGDRVLAVIRGIGLSNDVGGSLLSPDSEGQLRAMRAAYEMAGWAPSDVQYVECHGTGTPRGDQVELESLKTLFGGAPVVIGSVKSNVGHLLTAAGMAGLAKVVGAISRSTLPPNANASQVVSTAAPLRVLDRPVAWDASGPQRAAISGFGFGGINAHVLLEAYAPGSSTIEVVRAPEEPIAIVGLGVHVGALDSVEAFRSTIFSGGSAVARRPVTRWRTSVASELEGAWIEALEIPIGRFKVPPLELPSVLPQQLLTLEVAANAVEDAGGLGAGPHPRVGAIIGLGLDLETTTFHLRWVLEQHVRRALAKQDVDEGELRRWLDQASKAISAPLDAQRVLGALGGIVTSRLARELSLGGPSFGVQAEEGSGLRALEVASRMLQRGEVDRMIVGTVDLAGELRRVLAGRAIGQKGLPSDGAVAFVLERLSDAKQGGATISAVLRGFGASTNEHASVAIESAWAGASVPEVLREPADLDAQVGVPGAAAGLVSVAESALALRHRVRSRGRSSGPSIWSPGATPRRVGVTTRSLDGTALHVAMEEGPGTPTSVFEGRRAAGIFLVAAGKQGELARLAAAHRDVAIDRLAAEWFHESGGRGASAFVATSVDDLSRQLESVRPPPRTVEGDLAFVFPGSGSHYEGMGETLPLAFPEVLEQLGREVQDFSRHLFPPITPGPAGLAELIVRQVTHGLVVHDALRLLGVSAQAYMGYSLGESAGLFASRAWRDRDTMFRRTLESGLFRTQLTSEGSVLRKAWGPDAEWAVALVMRSKDEIRSALSGTATLLIVNAPGECVIGGRKDDVRAVVGRLGGAAVFLEGVPFVHLPQLAPVQEDYRALHLLPTTPPPGVRFYSAAWARSYEVTTENCAASIVANAMHGFDFTALIERAWADGVRVFVEPGPQGSCTRMIGRILGDRPHAAVSACQRGQDGYVALLNAAAKLSELGRAVDVSPLYASSPRLGRSAQRRSIRIVVGGEPLALPPLPGARAAGDVQLVVSAAHVRAASPALATQREPMSAPNGQDVAIAAHARAMTPALAMVPQPMPAPDGQVVMSAATVLVQSEQPSVAEFLNTATATARAHETFLQVAQQSAALQAALLERLQAMADGAPAMNVEPAAPAPRFARPLCLEFAIGKLSKVLGPMFAPVDAYPTRVRLPDEPLMLVDRIVDVEGEPGSLTRGRCITEHDVHPGAWYLDGGRVPVCISVEAGQADLFLSAYLGIDLQTKGLRVYRLLDAKVVFHRDLPVAGDVIRYDIRIDRFVRQGDTWLFFFRFDGTIAGEPFITMYDGCAGFFSAEQLEQGKGIVADTKRAPSPSSFTPRAPHGTASLSDDQVEALRRGELRTAFGVDFPIGSLAPSLRLPGGRMHLVDRILELDTRGGAAGLGLVLGEHDVTPDAWYLTCHFSDDPVMPGTLMYECCLHTLRVLLLRLGWVDDASDVELHYAPIVGKASQLKCRGQVLPTTKKVQYRLEIDEIGETPEPWVIATASMFADGKHVVQMDNMSVRIRGLTKERLDALWGDARAPAARTEVFSREQIIEYCEGAPSKCFGAAYAPFDPGGRRLARLPRDPFRFIDRVVGCEPRPLVMEPGGWITCEYDVPPDAWYFGANRQRAMPFSVLLEAALQPCGFLAAYVGSALTTDDVLSFRNLDGNATVTREVFADVGTLSMRSRLTKVSRAGGMLLQEFDFEVNDRAGLVYRGHTGFGFFPPVALAQQVGIRGGALWKLEGGRAFGLPMNPPLTPSERGSSGRGLALPAKAYAMIDTIDAFELGGGAHGLGFVSGHKRVDPTEWFFQAHFFQDPVMPGSLGLEALQQLLLVYARERFGPLLDTHRAQSMAIGQPHVWQYRGQVVPTNALVQVQAQVKQVVDGATPLIVADGQLACDGKVIYAMKDFALRLVPEVG